MDAPHRKCTPGRPTLSAGILFQEANPLDAGTVMKVQNANQEIYALHNSQAAPGPVVPPIEQASSVRPETLTGVAENKSQPRYRGSGRKR